MTDCQSIIDTLNLEPHPEGGWFMETWRVFPAPGKRSVVSAIYYLLDQGQTCQWHRIDCQEIWFWHAGSALTFRISETDQDQPAQTVLGPAILKGQRPQQFIAAGQWQSARADHGWALVSCVVTPGFAFEGWELGPEGWAPG